MKKLLALLLALCFACTIPGCGEKPAAEPTSQNTAYVGVSLAGQEDSDLARQMTQQLYKLGIHASVRCAGQDAATQTEDLKVLFAQGVDCLIVEAVDSLALLEVEALYKQRNIPVIACDTMLMDTDWVWGYISYDYMELGRKMAQKVVQAKQLDREDTDACTIEFFMGQPEDNNAFLLHQGVLEVLQPYINSGKLVCRSGRVGFEDCYTASGTLAAEESCVQRLELYSKKKPLDICFAGSDEIATGCRQALDRSGYTRENWPVLVGQGGEAKNLQGIKDGYQLVTYEKNPQQLAQSAAQMAVQAIAGEPFAGDGNPYNNHILDVPGKILPVTEITGNS